MGQGFPREGMQSSKRMKKSKCLVNKCLLGHSETIGARRRMIKQGLLGSSLSTIPSSYHNVVIYGDNALPGASPVNSFYAIEGEAKSFS